MASKDGETKPDRKYFVPLENNPDVMTSLVRELGMDSSVAFHDVFSLDPEMLAYVPRPAYALLLVFPTRETYEKHRVAEDADKADYAGSGPEEEVMWYKQTIGNACGLIGLLHAASNGPVTASIGAGTPLARLMAEARPLAPAARADLLYESPALEAAHATAAHRGETTAPGARDDIDTHYVCFVKTAQGRLWELDGARKGPLLRGELADDEDVLSERALDLGVRAFLKREADAGSGELRFSLIALAMSLD